jgi:hypothetical protein
VLAPLKLPGHAEPAQAPWTGARQICCCVGIAIKCYGCPFQTSSGLDLQLRLDVYYVTAAAAAIEQECKLNTGFERQSQLSCPHLLCSHWMCPSLPQAHTIYDDANSVVHTILHTGVPEWFGAWDPWYSQVRGGEGRGAKGPFISSKVHALNCRFVFL